MGIGKLESLDFHRENNWDVQHSVLILWLPERIQLEFPVYRDRLRRLMVKSQIELLSKSS